MSLSLVLRLDGKCCNSWSFASLRLFLFVLPLSAKSLVLFVVSSPWLVLNADVGDELLGYAADVRLSAVSCLQIHLEIDFFFFSHSLSLCSSPSAEKSKIKTNLPHNLTEDSLIPLTLWPLWACACVSVCVCGCVCRCVCMRMEACLFKPFLKIVDKAVY